MPKLMLISIDNSKVDYQFVYNGYMPECKTCKYANVCHLNLQPKKLYKIVKQRDKYVDCKPFTVKLRLVEVEEASTVIAVGSKLAIPNAQISFKRQRCEDISCKYYDCCSPASVPDGSACKILEVKESFTCPRFQFQLVRVSVLLQ